MKHLAGYFYSIVSYTVLRGVTVPLPATHTLISVKS